jgi:two-component system NtrC family sensor kinase
MVIILGTAVGSSTDHEAPDILLLAMRLTLLAGATLHTAIVAARLDAEHQRHVLAETVERELKARDTEAAELVTFTQALAASGSLQELSEAVIRCVRVHLSVRAQAIVLDAEGESMAVWEEAGRLEADDVERRRNRLQQSLRTVGSHVVITKLYARSTSSKPVPPKLDFLTAVEVPIQAGGRVVGVLLLADPRRGVLPPDRIGTLAEMARHTGIAVTRLERRRDEENRRTGILLRQMRDGVILLGPDGRILLANPAAREALEAVGAGGEAPEAIGDVSLKELALTPPGVSRRFRVQTQGSPGLRPVEMVCTAVGIVDGRQRMGTLVTVSDVTEEEMARRRLLQAEKMTVVGQTLAGVAHELNNPLAALIGYADLLRGIAVPPEVERPVKQMREQAVRATRIVRNLLNFARRRNPERTQVKIGEVVNGVAELFAYEARLGDIELKMEIADDLPTVLADQHAIQQVVVNLVQNAIHALRAAQAERRRITIRAHALPDGVVVSVRDNGPGVPEAYRSRLFEPFFTTKGANLGTGLGLALSRAIAREHGGELILEPASGEGACFTLRLPLRKPASGIHAPATTESDSAPASVLRSLAHHSVLVVDDEASVRESLVAQLGHMGSRVDSAADSLEAERLLSLGSYDAVLLDVRMPVTSGLELHRTIESSNPGLARRVVFMTGDFANDDLLSRVRETGNVCLEKPFTVDELAVALDRAWSQNAPAPTSASRR